MSIITYQPGEAMDAEVLSALLRQGRKAIDEMNRSADFASKARWMSATIIIEDAANIAKQVSRELPKASED